MKKLEIILISIIIVIIIITSIQIYDDNLKIISLENELVTKNLEYDIKDQQNEISCENPDMDKMIDACIQSSNNMNSAYNLLKKEYESLTAKYYASDDDFLIKENKILRKELDLYQRSEK